MYDFSKATDTEKYFEDIINKLGGSKITCVYCVATTWFKQRGFTYMQDEPLFIIFDNGKCLVIDYYDINKLKVEYREMTQDERQAYNESRMKDLFNRTTNIQDGHTGKIAHIQTSSLPYGSLKKVELKQVTEEYSAWIDGGIVDGIKPAEQTFNEIKFVMDNGKSFVVCADDAESDGYSLTWSDDAETSDTTV